MIPEAKRVYAATTLIRAGLVAGVTRSRVDGEGVTRGRVDWLRCGAQAFTQIGSTPLDVDSPLACFPAHRTEELVIVSRDGTLHCVPSPR